ncbi:DUF1566 domain-containing protein [Desulfococcaceae bacterium HSG8]|nr:DUF1566 domain-containing protein [Desulfococcaceae bacterium HSG8]
MKRKGTLTVFLSLALLVSGAAYAGSLNSTAAPGATNSYTLEDVYNRLDTGAAATQGTFTEPAAGPGSTGHTINEIYNLLDKRAFVPKSGQTDCYYDDGTDGSCTCGTANCPSEQDGGLEKGVAWPVPRFTDNGNGTATDNLTGLIWLKNANCWGKINWATAITNCSGLADGQFGLSDGSAAGDWRLPNLRELHSLLAYKNHSPSLPAGHPFSNVQNDWYWTSMSGSATTHNAYFVDLAHGRVQGTGKFDLWYVLPVRGGQ